MDDISGFPEPLEHPPPHLKTGLLIALAIRNINKVYFVGNYSRHPFKPYHAFFQKGAYMKDVIAFLCIHFPFFNSNRNPFIDAVDILNQMFVFISS